MKLSSKMEVCLGNRNERSVRIYYEKAKDPEIRKRLPQKAQTVEEAIRDYKETLKPDASSYGKTILADGIYVGDIWCYCIDKDEEPNAMLSFCIFEKAYWSGGIATKAVALFLDELRNKIGLKTIGAFVYLDNVASIRVLEKSGFVKIEEFDEEGRRSGYYQYSI